MGIPANNSIGVGAAGSPPPGDMANAVVTGKFTAVGPGLAFSFMGWANISIWASNATTLTTTVGSLTATVGSGTGLAAGGSINSVNVPPGTTWAAFSGTSGTLSLPPLTYTGYIDSAGNITGMASSAGLLGATVIRPVTPASGAILAANTTVSAITSPTSVQISPPPTSIPIRNEQIHFQFAPTGNAITVGGADANATFTGPALTWSGTVELERSFDGGSTWNCCNIGAAAAPSLAAFTAGPQNIVWSEPERGVLYRLNCTAYTSGTINYRLSQTAGGAMSLTTGGYAY